MASAQLRHRKHDVAQLGCNVAQTVANGRTHRNGDVAGAGHLAWVDLITAFLRQDNAVCPNQPHAGPQITNLLNALVDATSPMANRWSSRTLSSKAASNSPATIRNVMADLEELGFITSPHTSAGRINTARLCG